MEWLPYSILATVLLGASMSLYKIPSFKGYSGFFSTFWTNLLLTVFSLVAFLAFAPAGTPISVSWYALVWGALFGMGMLMRKLLLSSVETGPLYSVTTSLGNVATVIIGAAVLDERVAPLQAFGIGIIVLAVFLFSAKGGEFPHDRRTLLLSFGIVAASTASKYVQKLGAVHDAVFQFMLWQYFGAVVFALAVSFVFERAKFRDIAKIKDYWKGSLLIAAFSFLGGYAILVALSTGPMSAVYAIHPAYTFVAAACGWVFFREKPTFKKIALALLSVLGVALLAVGGRA